MKKSAEYYQIKAAVAKKYRTSITGAKMARFTVGIRSKHMQQLWGFFKNLTIQRQLDADEALRVTLSQV